MKCTQPVKTAASRLSALHSNAGVHQRERNYALIPEATDSAVLFAGRRRYRCGKFKYLHFQSVKRLLAAQQADSKRLSEQVSGLTQAVDDLRQSFSSAPKKEASAPPSPEKSAQTSSQATKSARVKRARSGG